MWDQREPTATRYVHVMRNNHVNVVKGECSCCGQVPSVSGRVPGDWGLRGERRRCMGCRDASVEIDPSLPELVVTPAAAAAPRASKPGRTRRLFLICALVGFPVGSFKLTLTLTLTHESTGNEAQRLQPLGFLKSQSNESWIRMTLCIISLLSMLNVYAVPWSEYPIVPSYPHICSAMVGVPHRPLLPSPPTLFVGGRLGVAPISER